MIRKQLYRQTLFDARKALVSMFEGMKIGDMGNPMRGPYRIDYHINRGPHGRQEYSWEYVPNLNEKLWRKAIKILLQRAQHDT